MEEVGAELAGEHLGDQVPQRAPTLLTEQHPSGGVHMVTRDNDVAQTLLLARKLNKREITFCTKHSLSLLYLEVFSVLQVFLLDTQPD